MKVQKILLTTDFSSCSRLAFAPAADLARRMGASLDLVNCLVRTSQYIPLGIGETRGTADSLHRLHRRNLQLEAADPLFKGIQLTTQLLDGEGPEAVCDFALRRETDLIVLSSHGFTGLRRILMGSFAERLLRLAPVPVLVFKSREDDGRQAAQVFSPRRILYPYDYSPAAEAALPAVKLLAATHGARVLVLYAWRSLADLLPIYGKGGLALDIELVSSAEDFSGRLLQDLREFSRKELTGLEHEEEVVAGDATTVILERAASFEADLICMSTHGWTGLKRLYLGSVAEKVLRGSQCPVLVMRAPQEVLWERSPEARELLDRLRADRLPAGLPAAVSRPATP